MKTLKDITGEEFEAEKIIKTGTDITGYNCDGLEVFSLRGITDFSGFKMSEGQSFDIMEPTQDEILRAKIIKDSVIMQLQLAQQQKTIVNLTTQISKLTGGQSNG